jgi:hypothetical protein
MNHDQFLRTPKVLFVLFFESCARHLVFTAFVALHGLLPGDVFLVVVVDLAEASGSAEVGLNFERAVVRLHSSEEGLIAPRLTFGVFFIETVHDAILL